MALEQGSLVVDRLAVLLATGLGVGRIPWAPGTFGTLWGIPLAWTVIRLPSLGWQVAAIAGLWLVGVPICGRAAAALGAKDPGCVVWDELSVMPLVFLGQSRASMQRPELLVLGFLIFRVFDISKPPPLRQLERLPGGWGVMADDVVAAVYAMATVQVLQWLIPWLGHGR